MLNERKVGGRMDELDKKILRVLQRDARLSFTKIAE
ncbi:AsnC family transcriptional regulator, partial [Candidatus Alkanophaga liquidiphilum]